MNAGWGAHLPGLTKTDRSVVDDGAAIHMTTPRSSSAA